MKKPPNRVTESVQRYRDRMRQSGLRLVQFWVPDTRAEGFPAECRRQSLAAARSVRAETRTMRWLDQVRDDAEWTP